MKKIQTPVAVTKNSSISHSSQRQLLLKGVLIKLRPKGVKKSLTPEKADLLVYA
jgi:hypothetical protein